MGVRSHFPNVCAFFESLCSVYLPGQAVFQREPWKSVFFHGISRNFMSAINHPARRRKSITAGRSMGLDAWMFLTPVRCDNSRCTYIPSFSSKRGHVTEKHVLTGRKHDMLGNQTFEVRRPLSKLSHQSWKAFDVFDKQILSKLQTRYSSVQGFQK